MLAVPWVVFSSYTEHCDGLSSERYQVRESTWCVYDTGVIELPKRIADDMSYALNEAHERRKESFSEASKRAMEETDRELCSAELKMCHENLSFIVNGISRLNK